VSEPRYNAGEPQWQADGGGWYDRGVTLRCPRIPGKWRPTWNLMRLRSIRAIRRAWEDLDTKAARYNDVAPPLGFARTADETFDDLNWHLNVGPLVECPACGGYGAEGYCGLCGGTGKAAVSDLPPEWRPKGHGKSRLSRKAGRKVKEFRHGMRTALEEDMDTKNTSKVVTKMVCDGCLCSYADDQVCGTEPFRCLDCDGTVRATEKTAAEWATLYGYPVQS